MPPKGKSKLTGLVADPYDPLYSAINIKLKGYNGPKAYTLRAQPKKRSRKESNSDSDDDVASKPKTRKRNKSKATDYSQYDDPSFLIQLEHYMIELKPTINKLEQSVLSGSEEDSEKIEKMKQEIARLKRLEPTLKSAIKHIKTMLDRENLESSKMTTKIKHLMEPSVIKARKDFIIAIFTGEVTSQLLNTHLDSLISLCEYGLKLPDQPDLIDLLRHEYTTKCKPLQANVLGKLATNIHLQGAYKQFTTPLFFALEEVDALESAKSDLLQEFFKNISNNMRAITYVFSDNLFNVLNIHLGFWREKFNDGHLLVDDTVQHCAAGITIATIGRANATNTETELPKNSHDEYVCGYCMRKIGAKNKGGLFQRSGESVSVDHTNPVGNAWINYSDAALCAQLTNICYDCNLIKSDTSLIDFFYMITSNNKRFFESTSLTGGQDLSPEDFIARKDFFIRNVLYALQCGVNPMNVMIERAIKLKKLYVDQELIKYNEIKLAKDITHIVDTIPIMIDLFDNARDSGGGLEAIKTLFGSILGIFTIIYSNQDNAIANLALLIQRYGPMPAGNTGSYIISQTMLANFFFKMGNNSITHGLNINYSIYQTQGTKLARDLMVHLSGSGPLKTTIQYPEFKAYCESILASIRSATIRHPYKVITPGISSATFAGPYQGSPANSFSDLVAAAEQMETGEGKGKTKKKKSTKK